MFKVCTLGKFFVVWRFLLLRTDIAFGELTAPNSLGDSLD